MGRTMFRALGAALILLFVGCASARFTPRATNEVPMYAQTDFTENQEKANAEFVESILRSGRTREEGSTDSVRLGFEYLNRRDYSTSMKRFNQGWLLNPENPQVYSGFGIWYGQQRLYEKAVEMFLLGLEKDPRNKTLLHDLGYTYNLMAVRHLYVAYEVKTRNRDERALAEDLLTKAVACLVKDVELYPDFASARMTLAASLQHLGRYDEAVASAEKAEELGDPVAADYVRYLRAAKLRF